MYDKIVIISRHQGAIEFVARQFGGVYNDGKGSGLAPCVSVPDGKRGDYLIPVIMGNASPDDVKGKVVYGNVPLSLAAMADSVVVIEFDGAPPRGMEYGLEEMDKAGARLCRYGVVRQM